MRLISHRGNIDGKTDNENDPFYIKRALMEGYDVEIDVWYENNIFKLGHDKPEYEVEYSFISQRGLWCHAKTIDALYALLTINAVCFFHDIDECSLTSNGYIWTYPGESLTQKSICVFPEETVHEDINICYGICSDYISRYKERS